MRNQEGSRVVFGDFVDRVFWGLLVVIGGYGGVQLQALTANVSKLNENMGIVLERVGASKERVDKVESRVDDLTKRVFIIEKGR